MEPRDLVDEICRCFINDFRSEVDPNLVAKADGFRRSRNLVGLTSLALHFDPAQHTIDDWRFLRQIEAFYKKNAIFASTNVCADAARASFLEAEHDCKRTNARLLFAERRPEFLDRLTHKQLSRMRRYIRRVLGPFRPFLETVPSLVKVTPGATSHASRRASLPQFKMRMSLYATAFCSRYVDTLYRFFGFKSPRIKVTTTNRVELVPKNWKTDRTIACEPEGNLPFQLAFDTYAKRRLRRFGIDLSDQSANQRAALEASVRDDLATVDFQAASDTISFEVVQSLFPTDWFNFLYDVRTPFYRGAFGYGSYYKFSSMGNGATFAVETLIFAAACYAVGSKRFLVYGDDVIIESGVYKEFVRLTRFLGFTVNQLKSYVTGPFRESCGMDAFHGRDVTPVYIRNIDRRKASLCHLVNTLACLALPDSTLAALLRSIVVQNELPFVPFQENTMSGVWIYPGTARNLGILKRVYYRKDRPARDFVFIAKRVVSSYTDKYKAYVPVSKRRPFVDVRGYYLWFLSKWASVLFEGPWALSRPVPAVETSSATSFEHKYVRKWVAWVEPSKATPLHLYWWSDFVTRPFIK